MRTTLDMFSSWCVVSHPATRTRAMKVLCSRLVKRQTALFSKEYAICFVLCSMFDYLEDNTRAGNYFCFIAVKFDEWFAELHTSNKEWLRACLLFVCMG